MTGKVVRLSEIVLPAYYDFWNTRKTYVVCKGSRGSGKSKHAALWHICFMMKYPLSNTLVVRKVGETLRNSCYSDLLWAQRKLGVEHLWHNTISPLEMTYKPTGQKILFRGLDDGYKIASISVPYGVLCFLWLEEFYEISREDDFNIVNESIRGELPEGYWKRVTITFNPWSDKHFAKKRFFDTPADNVLAMTTTYKDNPYLSATDLQLFEDMRKHSPRRYKVAGLGEWGVAEGLVFENWKEERFAVDEIRKQPGVKGAFGLDFGYTDPTAFFCGLIDTVNKRLYVFDEIYQRGMTNEDIHKEIVAAGYGKERIIGDCAEPKSIEELRRKGLRIKGATKGADSIRHGIQFLQTYEIIVHPRCTNFLVEISNYAWDKDKQGNTLNRPIDDFCHLIDACRYATESYAMGVKWMI